MRIALSLSDLSLERESERKKKPSHTHLAIKYCSERPKAIRKD